MFFSRYTPNSSQTLPSSSLSSSKRKANFSQNFWCEAMVSRETP